MKSEKVVVSPPMDSPLMCFGAGTAEMTLIESCFSSATALAERTSDRGNPVVEGLTIFRVGTFTDMYGNESTWEDHHLDLMVAHFNILRDGNALPHVPVRVDHSYSLNGVIGYLESVYRLAEDPQFLAVDLEFTEPDAYEKYKRGTFRNRSIELGSYTTNSDATYFPVVRGLAFVDLPAVEGLHSKKKDDAMSSFHIMTDKEESLVDPTTDDKGSAAETKTEQVAPTTTPPFSFSLGDKATTDYAAVQAYITALQAENVVLKAAQDEITTQTRTDFVAGLATAGKIGQPAVESMTKLAISMTPEQFTDFRASYELVPPSTLFSKFGETPTDQGKPGPADGVDEAADKVAVNQDIIKSLHSVGVSQDKILKSTAYRQLEQVNPELAKSALANL